MSLSSCLEILPGLRPDREIDLEDPVCITADAVLTYAELFERSDSLAANLLNQGFGRGDIAGIFVGEEIGEFMTATLAVLKAGAIYLPLPDTAPYKYQQKLLRQTTPKFIISSNRLLSSCKKLSREAGIDTQVVCLADVPSASYHPPPPLSPEEPASLYYTSGSTGEPKGILRTFSHILNAKQEGYFPRSAKDGGIAVAQMPSYGGFSVPMFSVMIQGSCLYWLSAKELTADLLLQKLTKNNIDILCLPLGLIRSLFAYHTESTPLASLRWFVNTGGEPLYQRDITLCRQVFGSQCRIMNRYGITEIGLVSTYQIPQQSSLEHKKIPIGKALEKDRVCIIDDNGRALGADQIGEIAVLGNHIEGAYWHNEKLTAEKYIARNTTPPQWLFKTGDLGRIDASGCLWHLGRKDRQIKIRGFRVEPGTLDSVLLEYDGLLDCHSLPIEYGGEISGLVSFIVPSDSKQIDLTALRDFLRNRLPEYMCPTDIFVVPGLPYNLNGKIDTKKLLARVEEERSKTVCAEHPKEGGIRKRLIEIWQEILHRTSINPRESFFDQGGDSLKSLQLLMFINKEFNLSLPYTTLIENSSVDALEKIISGTMTHTLDGCSLVVNQSGTRRPIFMVHGFGGISFIHGIRRHLSEKQPLYLFGSDNSQTCAKARSISELAAYHVSKIKQIQKSGPYTIGARLTVLALEVVKQLEDSGESVSELIIFDVGAPELQSASLCIDSSRQPLFINKFNKSLSRLFRTVHPRYLLLFQIFWLHVIYGDLFSSWQKKARRKPISNPPRIAAKKVSILTAYYQPRPYLGRLIWIRSQGTIAIKKKELHVKRWQRIAQGELETVVVPGTHVSMWFAPHDVELTRSLEKALSGDQGADTWRKSVIDEQTASPLSDPNQRMEDKISPVHSQALHPE